MPNFTLPELRPLKGVINKFTWQADTTTVGLLLSSDLLRVGLRVKEDHKNWYSSIYHIVTHTNIIAIPPFIMNGDDVLENGENIGNFILRHREKLSSKLPSGERKYLIKSIVCKRVDCQDGKITTEINAYRAKDFDFEMAMINIERQARNKYLADTVGNPISEATQKSTQDVKYNCQKGMQGHLH